ncbi:PH domain-containing protein [Saccharomonospora xinjiangensis]|uniref:PH domain-containing protein n=1 Tax=Saccharomonospora xinjiangensis TaxID=75294 RepID=UPI00351082BB
MTVTRKRDTDDAGTAESTQGKGSRAVFRVPGTALIGVLMLFMCTFPFAATLPYLLVLLVVPIAVAVWIVRTRTVATRDGLTVRTLLGTRELPWDAIKGFNISPKATVAAVLTDDTAVPLPSVRTRHLPVLSLVSEGRVPDPSGLLAEPAEGPADSDGESDESEATNPAIDEAAGSAENSEARSEEADGR